MEAYDGTYNFQAEVCYIKQLLNDGVFLVYTFRCLPMVFLQHTSKQAQDTHDLDRLSYSILLFRSAEYAGKNQLVAGLLRVASVT